MGNGTSFGDYHAFGAKFRNRSSMVVISGLLPESHANWHRVEQIRGVSTWLKEWCGKRGVPVSWGIGISTGAGGTCTVGDGLHLNQSGTSVRARRINRGGATVVLALLPHGAGEPGFDSRSRVTVCVESARSPPVSAWVFLPGGSGFVPRSRKTCWLGWIGRG